MTERSRRRVRRGWDITKIGALLFVLHQAVDLRIKLAAQKEQSLGTASSVVALTQDVVKLRTEVAALRKAQKARVGARAAADSVSSPGPAQIAGNLLLAPVRLLGALGKALLRG